MNQISVGNSNTSHGEDDWQVPSTKRDASEELSSIFASSIEWGRNKELVRRFLKILESHDSLRETLFSFPWRPAGWNKYDYVGKTRSGRRMNLSLSPLCHLIFAGGDLASIKSIYRKQNLDQRQAVTNRNKEINPLHVACISPRTSKEIISLLVQYETPYNIQRTTRHNLPDQLNRLPIHHFVLRCWAQDKNDQDNLLSNNNEESIQEVLTLLIGPFSAGIRSHNLMTTVFMLAVEKNVHRAIPYLASRFVDLGWNRDLNLKGLDITAALGLTNPAVLAKLATLHVGTRTAPQPEALRLLFTALEKNKSIGYLNVTMADDIPTEETLKAFESFVAENRSVKRLALHAGTSEPARTGSAMMLNALVRGMQSNWTLQDLELCYFVLRGNDTLLVSLFRCAPERMDLVKCEWMAEDPLTTQEVLSYGLTRLTCLTMWGAAFQSESSIAVVLGRLENVPTLKELKIDHLQLQTCGRVAADALSKLSNHRPSLLKIHVTGCPVDLTSICEGLKTNTTLTTLNVELDNSYKQHFERLAALLGDHNTTLLHFSCNGSNFTPESSACPWGYSSIYYYLELNHLGRGEVRQMQLSLEQFVSRLQQVIEGSEEGQYYAREYPIAGDVSLLYGLLRETPAQWSVAAGDSTQKRADTRRRKRTRMDEERRPEKALKLL
ncbi:expressed unknown protein [Seminavis robusta]|uniref:Uncharacterized protein n=1 Tax=Seminavis robusta TaxID=568900 RepID=A0A9N8HU34_9STRA|nr:expressed unknown protein [Seminavis robusta]|eukprot:Sro1596_g284790.1 n/a (666) ;mRNA; r:11169-13166